MLLHNLDKHFGWNILRPSHFSQILPDLMFILAQHLQELVVFILIDSVIM